MFVPQRRTRYRPSRQQALFAEGIDLNDAAAIGPADLFSRSMLMTALVQVFGIVQLVDFGLGSATAECRS
jgi:hypothetical protein